jgi:2-dehydro-3-deoxy-D-arabinonate dehydratase
MILTRHQTTNGPRWALDGHFLPAEVDLSGLMAFPQAAMLALLRSLPFGKLATGEQLAPLDPMQEVWAAGVTYLRSREARRAESSAASVYDKVYTAERPELFFKSSGWRVIGSGAPARIRSDSRWNVPEPELVLVINSYLEIIGYSAGNDLSSRDIEGENPLYLPQAKVYNGSCAIGPGIQLLEGAPPASLPIFLEVERQGISIFQGETRSGNMRRTLPDLVAYLGRELDFPYGVLLMTGTGIVPTDDFSLQPGDSVRVRVGEVTLENPIEA